MRPRVSQIGSFGAEASGCLHTAGAAVDTDRPVVKIHMREKMFCPSADDIALRHMSCMAS